MTYKVCILIFMNSQLTLCIAIYHYITYLLVDLKLPFSEESCSELYEGWQVRRYMPHALPSAQQRWHWIDAAVIMVMETCMMRVDLEVWPLMLGQFEVISCWWYRSSSRQCITAVILTAVDTSCMYRYCCCLQQLLPGTVSLLRYWGLTEVRTSRCTSCVCGRVCIRGISVSVCVCQQRGKVRH